MNLTIKVVCEDMPGASFKDEQIFLGIQRGEEVLGFVPGDEEGAVFEPEFRVAKQPDGRPNFLGPYAKGTAAERFFYLSWGAKGAGGALGMFRRAKIHLNHLTWEQVEAAAESGEPITVTLSMTDKRGEPRCASIRADVARWEA